MKQHFIYDFKGLLPLNFKKVCDELSLLDTGRLEKRRIILFNFSFILIKVTDETTEKLIYTFM